MYQNLHDNDIHYDQQVGMHTKPRLFELGQFQNACVQAWLKLGAELEQHFPDSAQFQARAEPSRVEPDCYFKKTLLEKLEFDPPVKFKLSTFWYRD